MADDLFAKVRAEGHSIRTLTVQGALQRHGRRSGEREPVRTDRSGNRRVWPASHRCCTTAWKRRVSLRLVSLKLSNVYDGRFRSELPLEASAQRQEASERAGRGGG